MLGGGGQSPTENNGFPHIQRTPCVTITVWSRPRRLPFHDCVTRMIKCDIKPRKEKKKMRCWCHSAQGKGKSYLSHHKVRIKKPPKKPKLSMPIYHPLYMKVYSWAKFWSPRHARFPPICEPRDTRPAKIQLLACRNVENIDCNIIIPNSRLFQSLAVART